MAKIIHEKGLEFTELFACDTYVYLWNGHPLASKAVITMEELDEYPCLSFDQGKNHSLYLAEEMKSTYEYRRLIKATDRATLLNFMKGLNAYTLCSGIICEELNGSEYLAVPLAETEKMRIGYVKRKGATIFMKGLNAYTLCSGIICEELNGSEYLAVPLAETEKMRIGYVKRKGATISHTGEIYIEELKKYKDKIM